MNPLLLVLAVSAPAQAPPQYDDRTFRTRASYVLDFEIEVRPVLRRAPEPRYHVQQPPPRFMRPATDHSCERLEFRSCTGRDCCTGPQCAAPRRAPPPRGCNGNGGNLPPPGVRESYAPYR